MRQHQANFFIRNPYEDKHLAAAREKENKRTLKGWRKEKKSAQVLGFCFYMAKV
jgi:hypothetical protein